MFRDLMRGFVTREVIPVEQELLRSNPDWNLPPKEIFDRIRSRVKELGLWALDVPVECGGMGLNMLTLLLVNEEQSQTLFGCGHSTPFWEAPLPIFPALYRGTDYQKEQYLYPLIRGDKVKAFANTEPDAGSDAAAIKTEAIRDGDHWVLNGIKRFISNADACDFCLVSAVIDKSKGKRGIGMFIVNKDNPGFRVKPWLVIRPEHVTEVTLQDCRVPDIDRLEGSGWDMLQEGLNKSRVLIAAECLGRARRALEMAVTYAEQRSTFGQPLSQRQFVQGMLAESATEIHLAHLMALEVACKMDQGLPVAQETFMLKALSTEMGYRVIDRSIQIHGGIGVSKELPLERMLREARVRRIVDGPTEVMQWVVAREVIRGWRP